MWKLPENIHVKVTYGKFFWFTGGFLNNCLRGYMKAGTSSLKGVSVGTFRVTVFVEASKKFIFIFFRKRTSEKCKNHHH
jgi:hypothetical protein